MFTICTLFSTLTEKHNVCVKGVSKQTSDPKNSTSGTATPGFEIPESATAISQPKDLLFKKTCLKLSQWFWNENKILNGQGYFVIYFFFTFGKGNSNKP